MTILLLVLGVVAAIFGGVLFVRHAIAEDLRLESEYRAF